MCWCRKSWVLVVGSGKLSSVRILGREWSPGRVGGGHLLCWRLTNCQGSLDSLYSGIFSHLRCHWWRNIHWWGHGGTRTWSHRHPLESRHLSHWLGSLLHVHVDILGNSHILIQHGTVYTCWVCHVGDALLLQGLDCRTQQVDTF